MLSDRQAQIGAFEKEKAGFFKQIKGLDRQIKKLGGVSGWRGGRKAKLGVVVVKTGRRRRAKNAMSLSAMIEGILSGSAPQSVSDIAAAAKAAGYKSKSSQFRNIVNQVLIKDKRFTSTGRGMYQLRK